MIGPRWREFIPLIGLVATGIGTSVILFTNSRFRLIMLPALLIVAGGMLDRVPQLVQAGASRHFRPVVLPVVGLVAGAVLAWSNVYGVRSYRIPQLDVNTGILERNAGHLSEAVRYLREGLTGNPRDSLGWIHLALALEQQGQLSAARQAYLDALAASPEDPGLRQMFDGFLRRHPAGS